MYKELKKDPHDTSRVIQSSKSRLLLHNYTHYDNRHKILLLRLIILLGPDPKFGSDG